MNDVMSTFILDFMPHLFGEVKRSVDEEHVYLTRLDIQSVGPVYWLFDNSHLDPAMQYLMRLQGATH